MFQKNERVSTKLFPILLDGSRSYHGAYITLRVSDLRTVSIKAKERSIDLNERYSSFIISKKVSKKAVARNLLKRRGRAVLRKHAGRIEKGYGYLYFLRNDAAGLSFQGLEEEIISLLMTSGHFQKK